MSRPSQKLAAFVLRPAILLCATGMVASAADIPSPVYKAAPATPLYNWTGFYAGLNAGIGTAQTRGSDPLALAPNQTEDNARGFAGGAQAGFNWQFAPNWLIGVEGDIGHLGIDRTTTLSFEYETGVKTGGYGTLRGRFGYAQGPSLIYVTGGAAFVRVTDQWNFLGNPFVPLPPEPHSASKTASGWTLGTGIEAMLGANWSARAEYLLIDAGKGTAQIIHAASAEPAAMQLDHKFHVFRFGLNYMFGGPASPATLATADWSGAYLGLNAGLGMSLATGFNTGAHPTAIADVNNNGTGFTGGLQGGYNWQFGGRVVVGAEADINHLDIDHGYLKTPAGQTYFGVHHGLFGTVRGRIGYAMGPALIYATGGWAIADVKNTMDFLTSPEVSTSSRRATGAVFGGGIEAAFSGNWSAKLEYLNVDLGGRSLVSDGGSIFSFENNFQVVRLGLNYRFGAPVVSAKY